jgi:glycosyltransferase involved in cell wall biosynthesis
MLPKVSVIVPTFKGAKKMPTLLHALQSQTFQDFELIVVIDGSTDGTRRVIENVETGFSKLIFEQPNLGRAIAKNSGAELARGDLLIFFDDDMEPAPDSILKHIEFHKAQAGILSGNQVETENSWKTDIQNYKAVLTKKWILKYPNGITQMTFSNLFFTAANSSVPRKIFNELMGFDKRLTDAEDFDLAFRALEGGHNVFFDKSNVAFHHEKITCVSYIRRIRQYQEAQKKLINLHPERKKMNKEVSRVKLLVYRCFSSGMFPFLIDRFNVFMILPKKLRYKFYDLIIHSLGVVYPRVKLW